MPDQVFGKLRFHCGPLVDELLGFVLNNLDQVSTLRIIMGFYKYSQELWKKKQSDVMMFLLRLRTWEYRQQNVIVRAPRPTRPEKARRIGYKNKQGFVIYRIRVRRGCRKKQVPKGMLILLPPISASHINIPPSWFYLSFTVISNYSNLKIRSHLW